MQFLRAIESYGHAAYDLIQFRDSLFSSNVSALYRLVVLVYQSLLAGSVEFMTFEPSLRNRRDPVTGDSK